MFKGRQVFENRIVPKLPEYLGHVFEDMSHRLLKRICYRRKHYADWSGNALL